MDSEIKLLIDDAKKKSLDGVTIERDVLKKLLELDPHSEECEYLGSASRDIARQLFGNRARIGSSIGIDICPCTMDCKFCSLGSKWGLVEGSSELSDEVIFDLVRGVISKGYFQITLRTTEFFGIDRLCGLGKRLRAAVPGEYLLTANTGEITPEDAVRLADSGFTGVYHTLRLREGTDTPFDPQDRIDSMLAVKQSPLMLSVGIEPIGSEHTNDEILDKLEFFATLKPVSLCIMKRVNVEGVPLSVFPEVDDFRLAQIVAVARLFGGKKWGIATHPPTQKALDYGANHITVETGANPRDDMQTVGEWKPFNHDAARKMIAAAGFDYGFVTDMKSQSRV